MGCEDLPPISQALTHENKDIANAVNPGSNLFVISTHLKCTCYPEAFECYQQQLQNQSEIGTFWGKKTKKQKQKTLFEAA